MEGINTRMVEETCSSNYFFLIPVVDAKGEEIDQGALLRYLCEIVWHPSC